MNKFLAAVILAGSMVLSACSSLEVKEPAEVLTSIREMDADVREKLSAVDATNQDLMMALGLMVQAEVIEMSEAQQLAEVLAVAAYYSTEAWVLAVHGKYDEALQRVEMAEAGLKVVDKIVGEILDRLEKADQKEKQRLSI